VISAEPCAGDCAVGVVESAVVSPALEEVFVGV